MLKKKICKRCWNGYVESLDNKDKKNVLRWDKFDEKCWKEGEVYCPFRYLGKGEVSPRSIKEQPPENCPFLLENIL